MSVLSQSDIRKRLNRPIDHPDSLVVTPLLNEEAFDADSLDLRLGTHFLVPQAPPHPFYDPTDVKASGAHTRIHVPLGSYLVVPAHQTVLGATLEFIKLPHNLSGQILTKSSVARSFTVIETAPWIHPSYRGCLTLEIANVSNTPVLLYPGRLIGQLILLSISNPIKPAKLSGSYLGPIYPEAPPPVDIQSKLRAINVFSFRHPCDKA